MNYGSLEARIVAHEGERFAIVRISGAIGPPLGIQAEQFINSVSQVGDYDFLYGILDSPGGSMIDSWIIYDFLTRDRVPRPRSLVKITGVCLGDAILIALAFEQIIIRRDSYFQFQPVALTKAVGTRPATRLMALIVARRIERRSEEVLGWMENNKKFNGEESLRLGLCNAVV